MIGRFTENTIYNEDCYKAIKDIPDKSVDCVYTDIPYDIEYNGGGVLRNNLIKQISDMEEHKQTLQKGIDYAILDEFMRVCKTTMIFIWCSVSQIPALLNYFIDKGCYYNILVWGKDNPVPFGNSPFLSDIEYCLCFYESAKKFNVGATHKHKLFTSPINQKGKSEFHHPTIKPAKLVEKHLLNATQPNDLVLDCFMGSGTTAVACKNIGRRYLGFEIEPKWHKIATDRLNNINANGQMSLFTF